MKLSRFLKCKSGQYIDNNGNVNSKAEVIQEIKDKVEIWVAQGSKFEEIRDSAVEYVLRDYEPYTSRLQNKVDQTMTKLGLGKKGGWYI